MIQLVRQETPTECSLACAAMVSGRSLVEVRQIANDLYHPNVGVLNIPRKHIKI